MPQFSYTARTAQGSLTQGTIEGMSLQGARDALRGMGLEPEEIHETTLSEQVQFEDPRIPPVETLLPPLPPSPEMEATPRQPSGRLRAEHLYFPLVDTLRLYAGWLLAWYFLVYSIGSYQHFQDLPFEVPYLTGLFLSPLVLSFTLASYLFLLLTGIWIIFGRGVKNGLLLTAIGIVCFLLYRANVS